MGPILDKHLVAPCKGTDACEPQPEIPVLRLLIAKVEEADTIKRIALDHHSRYAKAASLEEVDV